MYMRRLIKKVAAAVLLSACLVSMSACSASTDETAEAVSHISTEGTPVEDAMADSLKLSAAQMLGLSKEQLIVQKKLAEAQGDTTGVELYEEQLAVQEEMGTLRDVDIDNGSVVLLEDGSYTVILPVVYTEGTKQYVMNLNMATQQIQTEFTDLSSGEEEDTSIGSMLETATVYSAIGLGTVFVVLIFISLLIYCFKYIHEWENRKAAVEIPAKEPASAPVSAAPAPVSTEAVEDEEEIAAVIAAAVAAHEGSSSNGLVVRSIRRIQNTKRR